MFCGNCGKEIPNDTRFCAYCGAEQKAVVTIPGVQSAPADERAEISEASESRLAADEAALNEHEIVENSASEFEVGETAAEAAVVENTVSEPLASTPTISAPAASTVPTPNVIPTSSAAAAVSSRSAEFPTVPAAIAGISSNPVIAIGNETKPEKKYSLKHLVMCLLAAAVMAAAAGVFAALYFFGK